MFELLDQNSRHHTAVILCINLKQTSKALLNTKTIERTNHQKATDQLNLTSFDLFEDSELLHDADEHSSRFINKINNITDATTTIIRQNTRTIKIRDDQDNKKLDQ